ncbi:MAG: hypothetical protein LBD05_01295 [Mycoplasmataceae bacterium]|nr:hypothetical protein [Mycoplasmataceae bacterium]
MENILNRKYKSHALLIVETKLSNIDEFVKNYLISIIGVDKKIWVDKIINDEYFDIKTINGYDENIKKEQIEEIISCFKKESTESLGKKFYIIKGIENSTQNAINLLLNFIENPPENTYCILTTRAINLVLPTIRSRCQIQILKSNKEDITKKINSLKLDEQMVDIFKNIYYNVDRMLHDLKSKKYNEIYKMAINLINNFNDLKEIKNITNNFKKLSYIEIELFIKILYYLKKMNIELLNMIKKLKNNPSKILLFNKIWNIITYDNEK